jgi:hypothetical protein
MCKQIKRQICADFRFKLPAFSLLKSVFQAQVSRRQPASRKVFIPFWSGWTNGDLLHHLIRQHAMMFYACELREKHHLVENMY